jgi:predicted Ser/Thr protein kinase
MVDSARVEALFYAVYDLPPDDASQVLDRECAHSAEVRSAVQRLLDRDRAGHWSFLEPDGDLAVEAMAGVGRVDEPVARPGEALRDSERVGRFLVLKRIGEGAMAVVYSAYDELLDRRVALKIWRRGLRTSEHLAHEAKALARLAHPNVVPIYEVAQDGDRVFVAMELVTGQSLREWLVAEPRTWQSVLPTFLQAGRGLSAAHKAGLVHRDFKPDNVVVGDDGRARVVDFGIATLIGRGDERGDHAVLGTPAFMAPEQFLGEQATAATDQFGFCVALYRALYGAAPFDGDNVHALRRNVIAGATRTPPRSASVPAWVPTVLLRGLARDPSARFESMDILLAEIERRLPSGPEVDPNVGRRERFALAMAIALLSAGLLGATSTWRGAPTPSTARTLLIMAAVVVVGLAGAGGLLRKRLLGNRFACRVGAVVWFSALDVMLHRLLAIHFGEPVPEVIAVDLVALGIQVALAAVLVDRRFGRVAWVFLTGALIVVHEPAWAVAVYLAAVTISCVLGVFAWARDT